MTEMEKNVKGNKGFSLITVIITVAFIGILGLLVLYLALQNFNMKITGIKGKDSFYTAEQALEEIRLGLQQDVGDAMSAAYIKVMEDYNKQSSSSDEVLDELRQKSFETAFLKELTSRVRQSGKEGASDLPQGQYSPFPLMVLMALAWSTVWMCRVTVISASTSRRSARSLSESSEAMICI